MQNGQGEHNEKGVFITHEEYERIQHILASYKERETELLYLKQELAQLKRMIFGSKSERFIPDDPGQLSLGLDVEQKRMKSRRPKMLHIPAKNPRKKKRSLFVFRYPLIFTGK